MNVGLTVLLVEETEESAVFIQGLLRAIYQDTIQIFTVKDSVKAVDAIDENADSFFDICFVGGSHNSAKHFDVVNLITSETSCKAPVIFLNTHDELEADKLAMAAGATDYLIKNGLTERELERAIRYATHKRQSEERVEHLAFHDPLTNLPNRLLLQDRLEQVLARVHRRNGYAALMFLDLDNFKTINDSLGHSIGDLLLQNVAGRLRACCRAEDTVARLGGDEFVILLPEHGRNEDRTVRGARRVAEKISNAITGTIMIKGNELHVTASIGISVINKDSVNVDSILRQADTAMYEAKSAGKDSCSFFVPQMEEAVLRQVRIETQIRAGLKKNEFYLHYQPIIETQSSQITGAEALIRWQSPVLGQVSPAEFVPVAEECGLIWPLGEKILEDACKFLVATPGLPQLSINISSEQIHRHNFVPFVEETISATGIEPGRLIFELTETTLLADLEKAAKTMGSLRALGVRFALDDFGTGYSSLSYLKRLPFDYVKIDGSFTRDMLKNTDDQAIIDAILSLGEVLGFRVTAEGVETQEQYIYLQNRSCPTVQGFYFSKAISADELREKWLLGEDGLKTFNHNKGER